MVPKPLIVDWDYYAHFSEDVSEFLYAWSKLGDEIRRPVGHNSRHSQAKLRR